MEAHIRRQTHHYALGIAIFIGLEVTGRVSMDSFRSVGYVIQGKRQHPSTAAISMLQQRAVIGACGAQD